MKTVTIEVKYAVHLNEKYFRKVVDHTVEMGYGHSDAGPNTCIRRFLEREGTDALDDFLEDPKDGYIKS